LLLYAVGNSDHVTVSGGSINAGKSFAAQLGRQTPGSGYSGTGTCTVNGGAFTTQARCTATVNGSGGLVFTLTRGGQYTSVPTSISTSGFGAGTGASAIVTAATTTAGIAATCNLNNTSLTATVTAIGPRGAVSALAINQGFLKVGRHWAVSFGNRTSGGSGHSLQLNITSVDSSGTILAVAPTSGYEGTRYLAGDQVALIASGSQQVGSILNLGVGGGLTISGPFAMGIGIAQNNSPFCPVSGQIDGVTLAGASSSNPLPAGIQAYKSTVREGAVRFVNVTKRNVNFLNTATFETTNTPPR
jgi:hypothetical protein